MKRGKPTRQAYGETLVQLGRENPDIVVLDADLSKSTYTALFGKEFPNRFFNFGIAEANMVSAAAGLATSGKIPFCSSFACFMINKAFEQIRVSVAGSSLNVKFVASHGGISVGEDGFSQQSVEDIALMSTFPEFTIMVPADEWATRWVVREAVNWNKPVYIRTCRPPAPLIYAQNEKFEWHSVKVLKEGKDITIIAYGLMVSKALEASELLQKEGISVRIIDFWTLKPLNENILIKAAEETKGIVVAEEHLSQGGLGSMIARFIAEHRPVKMGFVSIKDTYAESGKPEELFEKFGLTALDIVQSAKDILNK